MHKSCSNCYFGDKCEQREVCDGYYPVGQQAEDEFIDEMIDEGRFAFREEWFEYIEDFFN